MKLIKTTMQMIQMPTTKAACMKHPVHLTGSMHKNSATYFSNLIYFKITNKQFLYRIGLLPSKDV